MTNTPHSDFTPTAKPNGSAAPHLTEQAKSDAKDLARDAKHDLEKAKAVAQKDLQDVKREAERQLHNAQNAVSEQIDNAKRTATNMADEQKNLAARQFGDVGSAFEKAGAELENSGRSEIGHYARDVGQSLSNFSQKIEGQSVGDIVTSVEKFARQQPLVFVGLAAAAGLVAARFLNSSNERDIADQTPAPQTTPTSYGAGNTNLGPTGGYNG